MDTLTRRNGGGPQEWVALADQEKFLLILPNGTQVDTGDPTGEDQNWNDCRSDAPAAETEADDVGFVAALMDWAKREFSVDPERVYATGASNGGLMAYRLATELGGRMAGIAVFIANLPAESECSATTTPVSVFICNGTADLLQPWAGRPDAHPRGTLHSADATRDYWIAINGCDSEPVETVSYPNVNGNDGSTVSSSLYRNVATGAEVKFYAVQGGGHSMPTLRQALPRWIRNSLLLGDQNQDIEGAQHAWAFLKRHTRQE
jgi:polyhydroxybutyrate depolymerase